MAAETFKLALVLKAFDGVTQPLRRINSALEQVQKPIRNFEKAFGNFKEASGINRLGESLSNVKESVSKVGGAVFSLVSKFALVGGVAAGIFGKMVNDTVESASRLVDLRNATGASVESIQRLGFAFEQSGGNTEDFQSGLVKFSKNLGDARRHSGPLFNLLSKYDKPLLQKMLSTKDTGEAMTLFIDKIAQAKTDTGRLALATAAVGKSANVALASLAKDGPENLKSLMSQTPGVISDEQASRAESFGDVLSRLSKQFGAMAIPITTAVIPALDRLAQDLTAFFMGKEQAIRDWAKDFGEKLPGRIELIKSALQGLWDKLQPVRDAIKWITSDSDRLQVALGILAGVVAGPLLYAMGALTVSMVELGIAMLTTPIGWICIGLLALVGIGYLVYTRWAKIKEFFITLWESPAGQLFRFFTPLGILIDFGTSIVKNWEAVKQFFTTVWDSPSTKAYLFTSPIAWLIEAGKLIYENWEKVGPLFESLLGPISILGKFPLKKFLGFGENGQKIKGVGGFFSSIFSSQDASQQSHYTGGGDGSGGGNLFDTLGGEGMQSLVDSTKELNDTMGSISASMANPKIMADFSSTSSPDSAQKFLANYNIAAPQVAPPPQVITKEASVRVIFENLPPGTEVEKDPKNGDIVSIMGRGLQGVH